MAEGPDPVSKTVLELEQEITCGICHEHYQEPKILPCCHYYCKECVLQLVRRSKANQPFPCPDCREPTLLPGNNPDGLTTAFFINRMKELHSRMEKAHGKLEAICEMCSGGKATAFCRQCTHFICEECVKSHKRMKIFAGHVISTLEDLKQGGAKELTAKEIPPPKCEVHEEPKKIFCFDCKHLICRDCIVFDHAGHKSEFVKTAAPGTRNKLAKHLSPLKTLLPILGAAVEGVKERKKEIEAEEPSVTGKVNVVFRELHDILDQCQHQLLEESSKMIKEKVDNLSIQEKGLDLSLGTALSVVEFVERTLVNASDEEVVAMQDQVLSRINSEVEKRQKETDNLKPVEEVDIGVEVSIAESLREMCQTKARVFQMEVYPLKSTVEGDVRVAEVDNVSKVTVHTCLLNGQPTKKAVKVSAELKSLVNGSTTRVVGVPAQPCTYNIEYTPKIRGRHHLVITVNDQPIAGSPFPVFVKIPPTKLNKPVRVIKGVHHAQYLTFNSSEQMIVTEYYGDVVVFDKQGKKEQTIKKSVHEFNKIAGVAVDNEDNLYVTDCGRHCVYKLNKEGKLLKKFGNEGSGPKELNFPRGVTVVNNQLLVSDCNNGRIQVLTTELEHVKQIGSKGAGNGQFQSVEDIATDKEQNMYVSDHGNSHIQVLNKDGKFFRSIRNKGSGLGNLSSPAGVCVDDHHDIVYVVECGNQCVSVFRKDGQFVSSFGKGDLVWPRGVVIDSDGFVYVCNDGDSGISVF